MRAKNPARCQCVVLALPGYVGEPFVDSKRARVAVVAPEENCLPGVGGGSVGGSGSRAGGESSRVRMHNAVTKTATSPILHNLLVPVTGMLLVSFIIIIFTRENLHSSRAFVTSNGGDISWTVFISRDSSVSEACR